MEVEDTKLRAGRYMIPVQIIYKDARIYFRFRYNKALMAEIKAMDGAKWHGYDEPPKKIWSIKDNLRNRFQLEFLRGNNPYSLYESPLIKINPTRDLRHHQIEGLRHILTRHYAHYAAEMGLGKTLVCIESFDHIGDLEDKDVWYIGPRAGIRAVTRELIKWDSRIHPRMFTYEGLVKHLKSLTGSIKAPRYVIFDESSKIKNPTAQRSQAALHLAHAVRSEWYENGYIVCLSGTPAPKAPTDWWHQCEVLCPGFLKEGNIHKFKARLCIVEERESITGGIYPHIVTWKDSSDKCNMCGKLFEQHFDADHVFIPCKDEVSYLYERMKGLVLVQFKKDCTDLPDKQYEILEVRPTVEILRTAKLIRQTSSRAITALTRIRELSDGFQYEETVTGTKVCPLCEGKKTIETKVPIEAIDPEAGPINVDSESFHDAVIECPKCEGLGEVDTTTRTEKEIGTPKDQVLLDELDEHEDIGRYIVWAGFTGSVDRLVRIANKAGWDVLRVDGRGYYGISKDGKQIDSDILLNAMDKSHPDADKLMEDYPRVCFIGHPKAGGMALTLTASPTELFYSNDFDGEARMQAEDRAHRLGMGDCLTIKDIIYMPTDLLVLENLKKKRRLQDLTMGQLEAIFESDKVLK